MTDLPTSRLCSSKHRGRAGQAVALATAALVVGNGLRLRRHAKALPALAYAPAGIGKLASCGSAAMSTAPSATSMCDQKSP